MKTKKDKMQALKKLLSAKLVWGGVGAAIAAPFIILLIFMATSGSFVEDPTYYQVAINWLVFFGIYVALAISVYKNTGRPGLRQFVVGGVLGLGSIFGLITFYFLGTPWITYQMLPEDKFDAAAWQTDMGNCSGIRSKMTKEMRKTSDWRGKPKTEVMQTLGEGDYYEQDGILAYCLQKGGGHTYGDELWLIFDENPQGKIIDMRVR